MEKEMINKIEITDEEIIQAFETCLSSKGCENCAFFDPTDELEEDCVRRHSRIALERFKELVRVNDKVLEKDAKRLSEKTKINVMKLKVGDEVKISSGFEFEVFGDKTFKIKSGPVRNLFGKYMFCLDGIGYYDAERLEKVEVSDNATNG